MQSFNSNRETRRDLIQRAHDAGLRAASGEDRKHIFWSRRNWCEAGYVCSKPDCDHSFYTAEVGVPLSIAYAERALFLELSDHAAGKWPARFLKTLPFGINSELLNEVWSKLSLFVLADRRFGLLSLSRTPEQTDAIMRVIELIKAKSTDANAWAEAARNAHRISRQGPDTNYRLKGEPAMLAAGAMACHGASEFAYAFGNPRYAAQALSWSAWAFRYRKYGELMLQVKENRVPADENGMVNLGASLWAHGLWSRQAERCESAGEEVRQAMYEVYADELIRLLKLCDRDHGPGLIANVSRTVADWRVRFVHYWNYETVG